VRSYERPARNAVVTPTADSVVVEPAQFGRAVDREKILAMALERLERVDAPATITIPIQPRVVEPAVTDSEAEAARQAVDRMAQPVVVRYGEEKWTIAASTVRAWIMVVPTNARVVYDIDREKVAAALQKLRPKIDRKPVNATYLTSNTGRVVGVKASKDGRTVDVAITGERIARAVISRAYGVPAESATAIFSPVAPKLSTAEAQRNAPLLKMISGHTTWFPYGERNFNGANIWIPGRIINGTLLAPGETFDFWKVVGIPSRARGFGAGGAIINGHTEPTGALAGGICSCSTTLFNAAAKAGLKLGARKMHYYYIDRYPLGRDATVWISSSGSRQNLTFTNDTRYPILIVNRNWRVGSKGYIRFEMWSVPNGRKVTWSRPIVRNVRHATTSVVYTSALPPGATRQDESAHDGMDVWVTRTVTEMGKVIHRDTLHSHYARVNGLILKGRAADATGDAP
jgi:vancomycin resistance protein YoaR